MYHIIRMIYVDHREAGRSLGHPAVYGLLLQGEMGTKHLQMGNCYSLNILYQVLSPEEHEAAARNEHNFDHPDAFDFPLLIHTLQVNKICYYHFA